MRFAGCVRHIALLVFAEDEAELESLGCFVLEKELDRTIDAGTVERVSTRLPTVSGAAPDSYRAIVYLAGPLVLSATGYMMMQFVDSLFLAWHSEAAVAASVPASMTNFLAMSLFMGVTGYVSTFVAQYTGAKRPERVSAAVWQGLYFAVLSGLGIAMLAPFADPLFAWMGHAPEIRALEAEYFRVVCLGAPVALACNALGGFFTGRGDTRTFMLVQLSAVLLNAFLDYALIFGAWGFPALGMAGAAWATVAAQGFIVLALGALFLAPAHRKEFATWTSRGFDRALFARLVRFGIPNGARIGVEIFAWSMFLTFVGRVGGSELAATGIAWRINGIAFFPLIGLSTAIATLVGHAQGAGEPQRAVNVTRRGLIVAEAWMLASALLFVCCPEWLYGHFHDPRTVSAEQFAPIQALGVTILRYVALYCVLDGVTIVMLGALQGAGDTRWTMIAGTAMNAAFYLALLILDAQGAGVIAYWIAATAFVMLQALVWLARFVGGKWKAMRVIEAAPQEAALACD